jgi:hypothetical protein
MNNSLLKVVVIFMMVNVMMAAKMDGTVISAILNVAVSVLMTFVIETVVVMISSDVCRAFMGFIVRKHVLVHVTMVNVIEKLEFARSA